MTSDLTQVVGHGNEDLAVLPSVELSRSLPRDETSGRLLVVVSTRVWKSSLARVDGPRGASVAGGDHVLCLTALGDWR